jgi:hypothetical protein
LENKQGLSHLFLVSSRAAQKYNTLYVYISREKNIIAYLNRSEVRSATAAGVELLL